MLAVLLLAILAGVGVYLLTRPPSSTTFWIEVVAGQDHTPSGGAATYDVTVHPVGGFHGRVALSVSRLPDGARARFSPDAGTESRPSVLTVQTATGTATGPYRLLVAGAHGTEVRKVHTRLDVVGGRGVEAEHIAATGGGLSFTVGGALAEPLAPGATGELNLRIGNPNGQPLRVRSLTGAVASTSAPGCGTRNFRVRQWNAGYPVVVPPHSTRSLQQLGIPRAAWPALTMLNLPVNQDACKGVTIALHFAGAGREA